MVLLHLEHAVSDFSAWKAAFDSDPVGRQRAGVQRYCVLRPSEEPNHAIILLQFETAEQALSLVAALQPVWAGPAKALISEPRWRICEIADDVTLAP
jgi:hypothetical protein